MTILTILGITEIYSFILEGKTGKDISETSRLEFLERFSTNNFALSDAEDNTPGQLNRGGIADLPFLRTVLAIFAVDVSAAGTNDIHLKEQLTNTVLHIKLNSSKHTKSN